VFAFAAVILSNAPIPAQLPIFLSLRMAEKHDAIFYNWQGTARG
jgi:hypothetical protein